MTTTTTTTTTDHRRQLSIQDAVNSVALMKQVLEPDKLAAIYKTVFAFRDAEIDTSAMVSTVGQLLCGHSNLVRSINTFLPEPHKVQDYSLIIRQIEFVNAIHRRFLNVPEVFTSFVEIMEENSDDAVAAHRKVSSLFRDSPEVIRAFESFLPEPIECGPSYKRRMINPRSSGRTELDSSVLNDDWVCEPPTEIRPARSAMDDRQKAVLECEDQRHDLDMLIDRGRSAKKRIKRKEELTAIDYRYIEELYGELGLEMVKSVKEDESMRPIVRDRIKQKVAELRRLRMDMNRRWAKVYQVDDGSSNASTDGIGSNASTDDDDSMQMQCD